MASHAATRGLDSRCRCNRFVLVQMIAAWPDSPSSPGGVIHAVLDVLLHHDRVLSFNGPRYRLEDRLTGLTADGHP